MPALLTTFPPWWLGLQLARRDDLLRELGRRNAELAAEEQAFADLSVRRERTRIARELHDIVAHHVAVMVVQAGAGRIATVDDPDADAERLRSIGAAGDQALVEMARLVDVLHHGAAEQHADRLARMLEEAAAGGLRLTVTPLPSGAALPAAVEEVAYRVVQEGLTNAMKHAHGAEVQVRLELGEAELEVEVLTGRPTGGPPWRPPAPGWVWPGCASASHSPVGDWKPDRRARATGACAHGCRCGGARTSRST